MTVSGCSPGSSAPSKVMPPLLVVGDLSGGNPAYTNISNFHLLSEGRYNGTRIVCTTRDSGTFQIALARWVAVLPPSSRQFS